MFKKDWRSIERHIGTRTCSQIRSHAQKYFQRLEKQQLNQSNSRLSQTNRSEGSQPVEVLMDPAVQRMQSAAPILEPYSAKR